MHVYQGTASVGLGADKSRDLARQVRLEAAASLTEQSLTSLWFRGEVFELLDGVD
ncbi:hypothetical protein I546_2050 [Mycobacterium kansasii 732]|nr:hypothetical protein I546_2050 [Mycobacterium kansasii 732]